MSDLANLEKDRDDTSRANPAFGGNWGVVKDWKETSRYERKSEFEARALFEAIANEPDGVIRWIQSHW
jgi:hypothetical protein